jgi:hypothetical protein
MTPSVAGVPVGADVVCHHFKKNLITSVSTARRDAV